MPGQNVDLTTPGSAVADQLQDILARKRAVAQQQLMNSLDVQKTQAQIANQTASTQWLGEQRQGMAEMRAAQAEKLKQEAANEYLNNIPAGQVTDPGVIQKVQQLAPALLQQQTIPGVGSDFTGPMKPAATATTADVRPDNRAVMNFLGTPAAQQKAQDLAKKTQTEKDQQDALKIVNDPVRFGNLTPEQQILTTKQAGLDSSAIERYLTSKSTQGPTPGVILGRDGKFHLGSATGQVVTDLPANAVVKEQPVEPQDHYSDVGPELDKDKNPTGNRIAVDTRNGNYVVRPAINAGGKSAGNAPKTVVGPYPDKAFTELQSAWRAASSPNADPKLTGQMKAAAVQNFLTRVTDPKVRAGAQQIIQYQQQQLQGNPNAPKLTVDDLDKPNPVTGKTLLTQDPGDPEDFVANVKAVLKAIPGAAGQGQ